MSVEKYILYVKNNFSTMISFFFMQDFYSILVLIREDLESKSRVSETKFIDLSMVSFFSKIID